MEHKFRREQLRSRSILAVKYAVLIVIARRTRVLRRNDDYERAMSTTCNHQSSQCKPIFSALVQRHRNEES